MSRRAERRAAKRAEKEPANKSQRHKVEPQGENQRAYVQSMNSNDITICVGPAGSGKSSVAVGVACDWMEEGLVDKIVITRPTVETGGSIGALPGDISEKVGPFLIPILEEFYKYIGRDLTNRYLSSGYIEICPLQYMRGRNFHNTFMILDESQNATMDQLKMFITRIGDRSRAIIEGDPDQSDLPAHMKGSLDVLCHKLQNLPGVGVCKLEARDIVRNPIIAKVLERLR